MVAALFALHPLHVESVAWIAERRDVLSGLFFVLTLGAYGEYVRRPQSLGALSGRGRVFRLGPVGQIDAGDAAAAATAARLLAAWDDFSTCRPACSAGWRGQSLPGDWFWKSCRWSPWLWPPPA